MSLIPPEFIDAPIVHDLYQQALTSCCADGLYMEFGVATGQSLTNIRARLAPEIRLYGFDSFQGLPEEWNSFPIGAFATSTRVKLPNTELIVGPFAETLSKFAEQHAHQHVSFMHVDCDLYSATQTVLGAFGKQMVPGSVILFDEIFGYADYEKYEYRAFMEFVRANAISYDPIGRWNAYRAAVRITARGQI
jgi:hypothetical protein